MDNSTNNNNGVSDGPKPMLPSLTDLPSLSMLHHPAAQPSFDPDYVNIKMEVGISILFTISKLSTVKLLKVMFKTLFYLISF